MKFIIKIFRTIWGAWFLLWFLITVILFAPLHMILAPLFGEKVAKLLMFWTYRIGAWFIIVPTLLFIKNHGRDKIDKNKSYIVVGNHVSNLDFFVNPHTAPMYIRVLVKRELEKVPLFGSVMKAIAVSVERGNKESGKKGLKQLKEKLDAGYSVFLYPEGTRNRTDNPLLPLKSGAFRMAIETQTPLLVTTIANARQINDIRKTLFDMRPGRLHVYWDEPIETKGMTLDDVDELMKKTKEIMEGHIAKYPYPIPAL